MNSVVKILPLLFFLFVGAAAAADTFETALRLAQNGAPQLALSRVERDQPERANVQQWLKWEPLRLSLLNELNRPAEVLERVAALPAGVPAETAQPVLWQGALAALRLGQGEVARGFLSSLLWKFELAEPQFREARRLVIQSYMQERRADEGYRAMLRYSQDYQPLSQNVATAFTDALLAAGAKAEAGTWLAVLDESSPLKLLVRLKSGLITPEQAVADARAAMAPASVAAPSGKPSRGSAQNPERGVKPAQPKTINAAAFWTVILQAAAMREDAALQVEAREQLLDLPKPAASAPSSTAADELWQSYSALALQRGNQAQLLLGDDDASWFGLAERLMDASPAAARALFAHLALRATDPVRREIAQIRLTALLQSAKLERAAVRLFADASHFPVNKGLSLQARHALGEAAAQGKDYVRAARLWRGLTQPLAGMPAEEWRLRQASVFVYGGAYEEAVAAVRLLPGAETVEQRKILFALGELAESRADAAPAADYYLLAAAQASDALAQRARLQAARSLERAGLRGDARKQYLMLLQTSPDANQQDDIRRALARL